MSAAKQWYRVAKGLQLVAKAALQTEKESCATGALANHALDFIQNAKKAADAAVWKVPQQHRLEGEKLYSSAHQNEVYYRKKVEEKKESLPISPHENVTTNVTVNKSYEDQVYTLKPNPRQETNQKDTIGITTENLNIEEPVLDISKDSSLGRNSSLDGNNNAIDELWQEMNKKPAIKEGRAVPSSRLSRAWGFASLGGGLIAGTVREAASRILGVRSNEDMEQSGTERDSKSYVGSEANALHLANSLSRLRGAALKLGQMLSIQDETILSPTLAKALRQVVHQGAESMPQEQLLRQLADQLGDDWRDKFVTFDEKPIAAASIGQVHRASIRDDSAEGGIKDVVVKVQYPGVADSIESDLSNLEMIVKATGLAPRGLFIDEIIRVGRKEVVAECDYLREMANYKRFKALVESDDYFRQERFVVPYVVEELTTKQILTTEYAPGGTIDKVHLLSQVERNRVGRVIMKLTVKELFQWRFMQTDPNWGNFLYDYGTGTTHLVDFGAAREYDKKFVDGYLRIVWANANMDRETMLRYSRTLGFLTGQENDFMIEAHVKSGFIVGEPFQKHEPFDFKVSNLTARLGEASSAFLTHRLKPPPEEVYTLHRRLAGAFNLCIKLGAVIECRDILEEVLRDYDFDNGKPPNDSET